MRGDTGRKHTRRQLLAAGTVAGVTAQSGCLRLIGGAETGEQAGGDPPSEVTLSGGDLRVRITEDAYDTRTIASSLRYGNRELLDRALSFSVWTPEEEQIEYVGTDAVTSNDGTYRLERRFGFDSERRLSLRHEVGVTGDTPVITVATAVENVGDEPVVMNRPDNHAHDGWLVSRLPPLADPVGEFRYHISGNEVYVVSEVERWQTHFIEGDPPFITHFDDSHAVTLGVIDGPTTATQAVTRSIDGDAGGVDMCVGGIELDPGASTEYTSVVAVHETAEGIAETARRLVEAAR
jgi:hypothetical protein